MDMKLENDLISKIKGENISTLLSFFFQILLILSPMSLSFVTSR